MNSQKSSLKSYRCTDGQGSSVEIQAEDSREAAQKYVDGGDWGTIDDTTWIDVGVTELDGPGGEPAYDSERITITLQPEEPECADGNEHEWKSPYSVLGGIKENPGVQGSGGGVIITTVCRHCGRYQIHNTWAQRPDTGEQGLESYRYEDADGASEEWVRSMSPARYYVDTYVDGCESNGLDGPYSSLEAARSAAGVLDKGLVEVGVEEKTMLDDIIEPGETGGLVEAWAETEDSSDYVAIYAINHRA